MTTPADAAASDRLTPDLLKLALVVVVGTFVVQMDGTMINVALATMQHAFHGTVATVQWIATGYLLAMAVAVPPAGWAAERFGSRPVWLGALTVFMAGSILCGFAWSVGSLVTFRVLQGLSGGVLLPLSQAVLAQAAGPRRLGRLMSVVGIPALLGPIVGPLVGGLLVDQLTWRWIFYINVPICLMAIVLSLRYMPCAIRSSAARLDVVGLALLSPALAAIVFGLSEAGNHGTFATNRAIIPLVTGAALTLAFAVHALRTRNDPIVDLRLMTKRAFSAASATLLLVVMALLGAMLLVPMYYQTVRGATALHAGLLLAPQGLGAALSIAVCSRLADRVSARPIAVVGVVLSVVGLLAFTQIGADTNTVLLSVALMLTGAGFGATVVPATTAAYRGLRSGQIPRATSALRIAQQIGASMGVAVLAITLQHHITTAATHPDKESLAHAFGSTFWVAVTFSVLALVPALLLPGALHSVPNEADGAAGARGPDDGPQSSDFTEATR